jgi:23S rRNA (cytidine2498-2'-O)-methyltransferase
VFARNPCSGIGPIVVVEPAAPRPDRVTPLLVAIDALATRASHAPPWRSVWVEFPDTNEGKQRSRLARALEARLHAALAAAGRIDAAAPQRLHVLLADEARAFVGTSDASLSRWPLGIPRLARPRAAPSRSVQKLAEALVTFLGDREADLMRAGQRAVDLGAAPGGWTWLLAQRGLRVTAVDNGALKGEVARDPLVTHVRADGLAWRPPRPVAWLVCDIVEQPIRIAGVVAAWIADGAARAAIFNLKLPMKKRYDEVRRCEAHIAATLDAAGVRHALALRQLYHDREEVTGYLRRVD